MNNKGQALVEFVIIMPVFIFIALAIFDLGNVIVNKYTLENNLDTIVDMYESGDEKSVEGYANSINVKLKYEPGGEYNTITISKKVNIITPFVSTALGKNYEINSKRTVLINEKIE